MVIAVDYYPLFAGGQPTLGVTPASSPSPSPFVGRPTPPPNPDPASPGNAAIDIDNSNRITKVYPALSSWLGAPNTKWQEIRDPNDTATPPAHNLPYQRYTFWIEDLGGYVDASVAGNTAGAASGNARPLDSSTAANRYKTTANELALFTLFDSASVNDPGTTQAKDLIANRPLLLTVPTLRQVAPGPSNSDITSPYLATRLTADSELPLVPFGYGYPDEGNLSKPKLDLNAQVVTGGDTAVQAIARKINDNLPIFGAQRKGGLTGQDYVNTIAASMIDYADFDSNATVGTDYRGYDSYPLLSEIYTAKNYKLITQSGSDPYYVTITQEWWLELWNMSNQVASGAISFNLIENHPIQAGFYSYNFDYVPNGTSAVDLPNDSTVTPVYPSGTPPIPIVMQPNEYKVLNVRNDTYKLNTGVSPPDIFPSTSPSPSPLPLSANATASAPITSSSPGSQYEITWAASSPSPGPSPAPIVDKSSVYGGVRVAGSLSGPHPTGLSNRVWRGSLPGFIGNNPDGSADYYDTIGDPRLAYDWGCPQAPNGYIDNSSMGARNIRWGISGNQIYKEVKPTAWPDGGHDSITINSGDTPGTATHNPPATPTPVPQPTKAVATISNSGSYATLAELGNIYDPGQWNIVPDAAGRWNDISNSTLPDGKYGGGMTLRIGRPEFTRFDQPGRRAWQLLDLFSLGNRFNTRGLVNVNTASRDVL